MHTKRPRAIPIAMTQFTRAIRSLINLAVTVLLSIFIWLNFKDFPFDEFIASFTTPIFIWHVALSLYYASWIAGTNFDVNVQELVYVEFPRAGKVPLHGFVTVFAIIGAGVLLGWSAGDIRRFAIAIDIFIVIDHLAWQYLIRLLKPVIRKSRRTYKQNGNYFSLEELRIVSYHIQGNWKWWRFTGTMPIVLLINAFAFSSTIHSYITATAVALVPRLSNVDASTFLSGILVLLFVIVAEIWSWVLRVRTFMYVKCIDDLYFLYELHPVIRPREVIARQ